MTKRNATGKYLAAIGLFVVLTLGGILSINGVDHRIARGDEARRVKAAERRIAEEKESQRIEMEAEQEQKRLAQEQEQEQNRLAQAKEQEQRRLAQEQEQKRLAEMERERILSQIPVVLNSNNFVVLSFGSGTLFDCSGDGLLFRENRLDPHTPWAALTDDDAKTVLRTQEGFDAATSFGPKAKIPSEPTGSGREQQMGMIWHQGQTLKERLTTRMEILGICEKYNKARARYFAASASSVAYDAIARKAKDQADQTADKKSSLYRALLGALLRDPSGAGENPLNSRHLDELAAGTSPNYYIASQYSKASSTQSASATSADRDLNGYITRLAELGVKLTDSSAYPIIPPMNLRREIVVELNSNLMPSTPLNAPNADTNTPSPKRSQ